MYTANELLFPTYVIPVMRNARGPEWQQLIDRIEPLPEDHPEKLAFSLMMIRLNGCMECETDSYRAMRGCIPCTAQTLRRYKGPDYELFEMYDHALEDICMHLGDLVEKYIRYQFAV